MKMVDLLKNKEQQYAQFNCRIPKTVKQKFDSAVALSNDTREQIVVDLFRFWAAGKIQLKKYRD